MTAYPSLKRWLAAGLTFIVIGVALYIMNRNGTGTNPIEPDALAAQDKKATGQDWIMYGGTPSRNMANTLVKGLPTTWDADPKKPINIKWVASLGSKAYGGPIVAGGRVFVGTNNQEPRDKKWIKPDGDPIDLGVVMCFDEAKGAFNWQAVFPKLPGGLVVDWPREGICSSPHIEGDRMYFVSNRCEVVCADVKTGKAHWKLDMIGKLGVFPHNMSDCSPLLVGDHLWVVTSNGVNEDHINVPAPKAPSFIKVDKANGNVLWQDNTPTAALLAAQKGNLAQKDFFKLLVNRGELIQHGQWANPSYGVVNGSPQVVFPGGDGWIYSFDPQGKLIWKFDCNPKDAKYELSRKGTRNDFIASPVIYKDRVYIGTGQDPEHELGVGHLWCIDMTKKGDVSPELVTDDTVFPPKTKPNPNTAKVWHYGGSINDPKEREKLQRNYYFGRTMSTCAIHEDILYVAELDRYLHCLDANTGKPHWSFDTKSAIWSSPYYADGKVYLGTDSGTVFVFEHGTKLKKLAENDMEGAVRATPIAANGVLFVMTENKLYAIKK
jgi:outer membrane protein assembly factor BamB